VRSCGWRSPRTVGDHPDSCADIMVYDDAPPHIAEAGRDHRCDAVEGT
jgi:hypothetical protein